ncbi:dolichyldiphosphatase 1 isoform X2 [Strongylocentrotus purpuratus]|uniref:Dolichyldiphosphatase n=1 Tax=Strongylocentrotus purpuratus TaxID=7668 RepID=A0A7M7T4N1_STRPU|nr:dolichyldiphosphatase 1 isoform X2 [Strongylocentrotus purpuratus]
MAGHCQATEDEYDAVKWKAISLTFVEYPDDDIIGKFLAYVSLVPLVILVGFVTLLLFRRELHTITFFGGIVLSEGVNWIAKNTIQEPRPCRGNDTLHGGLRTEYGMPSSHSQLMWFFATYTVLFIYIRLHQPNSNLFIEQVWRHLAAIGVILVALLVSGSRVYLKYHTVRQVVCGGLLGILLAVPWFIITQVVLIPLFPYLVSWPICEK